MSDNVLVIRGLKKRFDGTPVLNGIDLDVRRKEIFALLGPNGAGKSTLIGSICGTVRKDEGRIELLGQDLDRDPYGPRYNVGLVPQEVVFDPVYTLRQALLVQQGLYGMWPSRKRADEMLAALHLTEKADRTPSRLSGGMKRRLLIGKALVHNPALVFLDEPTAGVDSELRKDLWNMILRLRDQGTSVFLTTHYLDEAEMLADRIAVIDKGRLLTVEDKATMLRRGGAELRATLGRPLEALPATLAQTPGLKLAAAGTRVEFSETPGGPPVDQVLQGLYAAHLALSEVEIRRSKLEEILSGILKAAPLTAPPTEPSAVSPPTGHRDRRGPNWIGMATLLFKLLWRISRLPTSTSLAPLVTNALQFVIFGGIIGGLLSAVHGYSYAAFIVPGLVSVQLAISAFWGSAWDIFESRQFGHVIDLLVAPLRPWEILFAWVGGAVARALIVAILMVLGAAPFIGLHYASWPLTIAYLVFTPVIFGAVGVLVSLWADKPEPLTAVLSIAVTPLTMLSGSFYAFEDLPQPWRDANRLNPDLYLVEGLRSAMLGRQAVDSHLALAVLAGMTVLSLAVALAVLRSGYKLRH